MTDLVQYHHETSEVALFVSDGKYWIGAYNPRMTHQNGEPLYYLVSEYFETEQDGIKALATTSKDIF